jgi:hypothetical protein
VALETTTEHIAKMAASPNTWLIKAVHLFCSAEMILDKSSMLYHEEIRRISSESGLETEKKGIEDAFGYLRVGLLIAGYGFETLMKYGYIKQNRELMYSTIIETGQIPHILKTHDLLKLSKLISLPIHLELALFLKKLSDHSIWAGRYPVPLNSSQFDDSLLSLSWSQGDVEDYYAAREAIFHHFQLNYARLKMLGVGLTILKRKESSR